MSDSPPERPEPLSLPAPPTPPAADAVPARPPVGPFSKFQAWAYQHALEQASMPYATALVRSALGAYAVMLSIERIPHSMDGRPVWVASLSKHVDKERIPTSSWRSPTPSC